jgi:hypothetical protein
MITVLGNQLDVDGRGVDFEVEVEAGVEIGVKLRQLT